LIFELHACGLLIVEIAAALPTGTGWVCSGEAQIFERIAFPRITTYDNTATPTHDGASVSVATAPVDVGELRTLIGDAIAQAEASDPIAVKAKIAELQRQNATLTDELAKLSTTRFERATAAAEHLADQAHAEGFDRGWHEAIAKMERALIEVQAHFEKGLRDALQRIVPGLQTPAREVTRVPLASWGAAAPIRVDGWAPTDALPAPPLRNGGDRPSLDIFTRAIMERTAVDRDADGSPR
jgi:uncharacterized protein YndB with AHSA1/START domain